MSAPRASSLRDGETGVEKHCVRCDEWWPADLEFFFSDPKRSDGLFYCCKACYREWFRDNKAKKVKKSDAVNSAVSEA